ncbi:MAG: SCP2 sterol-binding domain-containing protein [Ectothiorhodospiraceae bacterium]
MPRTDPERISTPFSFPPRPPRALIAPVMGLAEPLIRTAFMTLLRRTLSVALYPGDLEFLQGRCLGVEVPDLAIGWRLTAEGDLPVWAPPERTPDAVIRGESGDFLLLVTQREDPDTLFFRRRLVLQGDTELGLQVKNLLDTLEPDAVPRPLYRLMDCLAASHSRAVAGSSPAVPHQ